MIFLASNSPRRKKLLKQIGIKFKVIKINYKEKIKPREAPVQNVKRISKEKLNIAREILSKTKNKNYIIITADTIVVIDNKILGKPKNKKDAKLILNRLSGRTHFVYTAFSIYDSRSKKSITDYEKTAVTFRKLKQKEILNYVESGSPMDKAGAYGIQDDHGAVFVKKINGCYYNVVGLPLSKLYQYFEEFTN